MKKIILMSLILMISSCGKDLNKKNNNANTITGSGNCLANEICNVQMLSSSPTITLAFSVPENNVQGSYAIDSYGLQGQKQGELGFVSCSSNTSCTSRESQSIAEVSRTGNGMSQITVNISYFLGEGSVLRVFRR